MSSMRNTGEIIAFLEDIKACRENIAPWSNTTYINMTILNETMLELNSNTYRYSVLTVGNASLSGAIDFDGYQIEWNVSENVTTTGGQRIEFKIYKSGKPVDSLVYYYIPFELSFYCVSIRARSIKLSNGDLLTFVFMHGKGKELWLVLKES
ncbi:hypothetical protein E3E22_09770 [Thermococcus sp. MV5]|uniref:hypothetical protein n=1 Tax=Thermococcus sp. MV5 TaxID=1638272 RepID=UPI00143B3A9B|nr:hypothetical protein [Thermococcus sp. MV5]NJE26893.1 hypothetical protein [Thermococcus sp. MV5]